MPTWHPDLAEVEPLFPENALPFVQQNSPADAARFWRLLRGAAVNSNEGSCDPLLEICHSQDAYVCWNISGNTKYQIV